MKASVRFFLTIFTASLLTHACGKDLGAEAANKNECGFRYVAGQKCIVCEKGGVSCDWD